MNSQLLKKYNIPVPRYTSYPPVPYWNDSLDQNQWFSIVNQAYNQFHDQGISLYIHLPYCESLCTYCGCNKYITKKHEVEIPYIQALLNEWNLYVEALGVKPLIREIHLGGGTPTFFSAQNIKLLLDGISLSSRRHSLFEGSIEGHPNNTTREHLEVLYHHGFRRLSLGIQDLNPQVQEAIHRIQPLEKVQEVYEIARELGFNSINFDLIYGLPYQSLYSLKHTFEEVLQLKPERIAFYSYAHLPQAFPAQKSFEQYLPVHQEKRDLYELGKHLLLEAGYFDIGMDHFTLPEDELYKASVEHRLHRNFMGYTVHQSPLLIGLGSSAISDVHLAYYQNEKNTKAYQESLLQGKMAGVKAHILSREDQRWRSKILSLSCQGYCYFEYQDFEDLSLENRELMKDLIAEELVYWESNQLHINRSGYPFIRNICSALDQYKSGSSQARFSQSV